MMHKRLIPAFLAVATAASFSCNGSGDEVETMTEVLCAETETELMPFRGEWQTIVDTAFPLSGEDGISTITIGGDDRDGNWGNKGDVEVLFDQDGEKIIIEARRYTHAYCGAEAEDTYSKMFLWAGVVSSPKPFKDLGSDDSCIPLMQDEATGKVLPADASTGAQPWRNGCYVYHYFDGQSAPQRSGSDLRVHLPKAYKGTINVETEDNDIEDDYPLRGDVYVEGLCNGGSITLANGIAEVKMCDDLSLAPICSADAIATCEEQGWDPQCGCSDFGKLDIKAQAVTGPSITIDIPTNRPDLWVKANLENQQTGAVPGEPSSCDVDIQNCDGNCVNEVSPESPWKATVTYNYPGEPAINGAGYAITATSERCQAIPGIEGPDSWVPGEAPDSTRRGVITLCTGCL